MNVTCSKCGHKWEIEHSAVAVLISVVCPYCDFRGVVCKAEGRDSVMTAEPAILDDVVRELKIANRLLDAILNELADRRPFPSRPRHFPPLDPPLRKVKA